MLDPYFTKNDKKANWIIWIFSIVVFALVVLLGRYKLNVNLGFDVHIFATANAAINTIVAILLVAALVAVRKQKYRQHKKLMIAALILSVLFLLSYVTHRLFAGESRFGDANHDGLVSDAEIAMVSTARLIYFIILSTHIILASLILPFILFTAYRGLTSEFPAHKKLARITWPLWFYVAVTGPVVYFMIAPYYR
jgi:putative membrane protein